MIGFVLLHFIDSLKCLDRRRCLCSATGVYAARFYGGGFSYRDQRLSEA